MRMIMLNSMVLSLAIAIATGAARAAETERIQLEELKIPRTAEEMSYFAKRCSALSRTLFEYNSEKKGNPSDTVLLKNLGNLAHSYSIMAFNLAYREKQKEEMQSLVDYASINSEIANFALAYVDLMKKGGQTTDNTAKGLAARDAGNCAKTYRSLMKAKETAQ